MTEPNTQPRSIMDCRASDLLFTEAQLQSARNAVRVMLAYDTPSDRRRRRLAKLIVGHVPRVQQSVYQGDLSPLELRLLRKAIEAIVNREQDRLLITPLCVRCSEMQECICRVAPPGAPVAGTATSSWHALTCANLVVT